MAWTEEENPETFVQQEDEAWAEEVMEDPDKFTAWRKAMSVFNRYAKVEG